MRSGVGWPSFQKRTPDRLELLPFRLSGDKAVDYQAVQLPPFLSILRQFPPLVPEHLLHRLVGRRQQVGMPNVREVEATAQLYDGADDAAFPPRPGTLQTV